MGKPYKYAEAIKEFIDGAEVEYSSPFTPDAWEKVNSLMIFETVSSGNFRVKPKRVYPKSSLKIHELHTIYSKKDHISGLADVANEAVKRHIQDQEKAC